MDATGTDASRVSAAPSSAPTDRTWLVALAAGLWGTDALLRQPLSEELSAATIVFVQHVIIVLVTLPLLPAAVRAVRGTSARARAALLGIGAGASATATVLFTAAFQFGDPVTPVVLQKLQPVFAILAAWWLLGERISPRFPLFAVPALAGAWLLAFPDPLDVGIGSAAAAVLSVGAAALWASGTVLGRLVGLELAARHLTVLRFAVGLPASLVIVLVLGAPLTPAAGDLPALLVLALVPGLLALTLYYRGLRATPAARATLAELAFPVTAVLVGVGLLGGRPTVSQWTGLAVVVAAVTALSLHERTSRSPAVTAVPAPVA